MTAIFSLPLGPIATPLQTRTYVTALQREMNSAQSELSSGYIFDPGAALGGQIGQAVSMRQTLDQTGALLNANSAFTARMQAMDASMSVISNVIQSTRNDAVNNATLGPTDAFLASASSNFAVAVSALNTRFGDNYVFAGQNSGVAPLVGDPNAGPAKTAIDQAFVSAFGVAPGSAGAASITPQAMKDFLSGSFSNLFQGSNWSALWSSASSQPVQADIGSGGSTPIPITANDDSMKAMTQGFAMLTALGLGALSAQTRSVVMTQATVTLSAAQDGLTAMQATSGIVQRGATLAAQHLTAQQTMLQTNLGTLENADPAQAAATLSQLTTQLETSYSLTARLAKLSLTQFI